MLGMDATRDAPSVARPTPTGPQAGPFRVAERPVVPGKPGNAGGGKGLWVERSVRRGTGWGLAVA